MKDNNMFQSCWSEMLRFPLQQPRDVLGQSKSERTIRKRLPVPFGVLIDGKDRDKEQYVFVQTNKLVLKEQVSTNAPKQERTLAFTEQEVLSLQI